jgi:hypothetical protein
MMLIITSSVMNSFFSNQNAAAAVNSMRLPKDIRNSVFSQDINY